MMSFQSCFMAFGAGDPYHESPMSSEEASTGYLQDAVAEWMARCKRRRTGFGSPVTSSEAPPAAADDIQELLQGFWDSNCVELPLENFDCLFQYTSALDECSLNYSDPMKKFLEAGKTPAEVMASSPAASSQKNSAAAAAVVAEKAMSSSTAAELEEENSREEEEEGRRRWRKKKVAYPFAVVKPAGLEGDVTLAEINERILMRPTRPVKHPVGEFACRPWVFGAAGGMGLSGKAVVGLTRIHTPGRRGTITIIRTRG
ncbi:Protein XRI1 [Apostasia shenzhenica]|uniref:Protein XRI1 n=1 Tax=Apostasia shenzhenica TaxID=1088818 RepID=A0A2I0B173_9ASPA|nr:Protein XRI1 [Apostasia shenzhenica]